MENTNIHDYILSEETAFKTTGVPIVDGYEWSFYEHVKRSTLYKNSQYETGKNDDKPFKNIIRPILNVAYRSEGFDVKDIEPYADSEKDYYKSFLVRKFHNKWARKNDLDTFIDELVESYVDYGGVIVKNVNSTRPEVVPLQRLAFCDQTDILSGPICEKHMYSIDQLLDMSGKWDKNKIEEAIDMARAEKDNTQGASQKAKTPGKYIEVYEVHGTFPTRWLNKGEETDGIDEYSRQIHIVTYYKDESDNKHGITLFSSKEKTPIYKVLVRDKIYGRALGFGGIEELFEPQVWVNYSQIQIKEMLDVAALMILQTASSTVAKNNSITDLKKGKILEHEDGKPITQVQITPINMQQFENSMVDWENHARTTGSANEAQLGVSPTSGTPFKLQELVVGQGQGLHEYRRGKISTFMAEIYRDWILQYLVDDMNKGAKWIDELTLDELQEIGERISITQTNKKIKDVFLKGGRFTREQQTLMQDTLKKEFIKGGNKKFLEIVKKEFESIPVDVEMNIAGKQKNLGQMTEKLTNVFRTVIANPAILAQPPIAKLFNQIIESSGLSPVNFSTLTLPQEPQTPEAPQEPQAEPVPLPA